MPSDSRGGWIKMRRDLWNNPKVVTLASRINATKAQAIGALHGLWSMFDAHSEDGLMQIDPPEALDAVLETPGFAEACIDIGWLCTNDDGLMYLPRYEEHNGPTAKKRAADSERQSRKRHAGVTEVSRINATKTETETEKRQREEEEEEEQNTSSSGDDGEHKSTSSSANASFSQQQIESIYRAYPRKVEPKAAKAKIKIALKEISKREGVDDPVSWLLGRVQAYATARNGCEKKFTPHPATWFNRGRYDDDPKEWLKDERKNDGKQQQRFSEGEW